MGPVDFDDKLTELRKIEQRMKTYTDHSPISKVLSDQQRAQQLYDQIALAISQFKNVPRESLDDLENIQIEFHD